MLHICIGVECTAAAGAPAACQQSYCNWQLSAQLQQYNTPRSPYVSCAEAGPTYSHSCPWIMADKSLLDKALQSTMCGLEHVRCPHSRTPWYCHLTAMPLPSYSNTAVMTHGFHPECIGLHWCSAVTPSLTHATAVMSPFLQACRRRCSSPAQHCQGAMQWWLYPAGTGTTGAAGPCHTNLAHTLWTHYRCVSCLD